MTLTTFKTLAIRLICLPGLFIGLINGLVADSSFLLGWGSFAGMVLAVDAITSVMIWWRRETKP